MLNNPVRYVDPSRHCPTAEEGGCERDEHENVIFREDQKEYGVDPSDRPEKPMPQYGFWDIIWARPGLGPVQFGPTQLHIPLFWVDLYYGASGFGYKGG